MYFDQTILATFCKGRTVVGLGPVGGDKGGSMVEQEQVAGGLRAASGLKWAPKRVALSSLSLRSEKGRLKREGEKRLWAKANKGSLASMTERKHDGGGVIWFGPHD